VSNASDAHREAQTVGGQAEGNAEMSEEAAPAPEPMKGAFGANTVPETPDPTHDPAAYIGDGHYDPLKGPIIGANTVPEPFHPVVTDIVIKGDPTPRKSEVSVLLTPEDRMKATPVPSRAMPPIRFVPSPNQSPRLPAGVPIRLIVAHDCQGSADGAVAYFATRKSEVSAHLVVPETGDFVYQCVPLSMKAWHAVAYNSCSIGVEMGGYAENGFSDGELDLSALTIAWLLRAYGLPCVFVTDGIGEGWTTHYRLGKAGGGHTDFTTDPAVENAFAERVYAAYEKFGDGPLPVWALYGAPAPHSVSLPPAMPDGWSPTPMVMKNPGDTPAGGPVSGYVPGSIGDIQFRLRLVGANPLLVVDGIDGPATESALEVFERSCGLPVTKTINPATWTKLEEMSAGRIARSPLASASLRPLPERKV
jgi:hypothetical protein